MALPEEETIEMQYFPEKEYDDAAHYQGNYRTHIEMNLATTAAWFPRLIDHKVCHEGYPGHHRASEMLEGVWGNAAMLLDEGRSEAEVAQFFVKHMLLPEDRATSYCRFFATSSVRPACRADLWERPNIGATLVTGAGQIGDLPPLLNRTMDALATGWKHLACPRMICRILLTMLSSPPITLPPP